MNAKELLEAVRADLQAAAGQGRGTLNVVDLDRYFAEWERILPAGPIDQVTLDRMRATFEAGMAAAQRKHEGDLAMFRSVIEAAWETIKASTLVNGGAAVALLAFMGHLAGRQTTYFSKNLIADLAVSMLFFVAGLFFAVLSWGAAYVTQTRYYAAGEEKGRRWRSFTGLTVGLSWLLFIFGTLFAFQVFRTL